VKRTVLAGGICLLCSLPAQALNPDVKLSATFGLGLSWFQDHNELTESTDVDMENNASNLRITAATDEEGIRAFLAYERGASNDRDAQTAHDGEDVREFFGGISGRVGTVLYGRKSTDYKLTGAKLDPFYNTSLAGFNGRFASEGAGYGLSALTNGFTSNTIAVRSSDMYGFTVNAGAYVNDRDSQTGSGDRADYALGVGYANSDWLGLDVGLQTLDINGDVVANAPSTELSAYRLHAAVGQQLWTAGLSYEVLDVELDTRADQFAFLSATYQVAPTLKLAVTAGNVRESSFDGTGATLGVFYDLTHSLTTYAAARYVQLEDGLENKFTVIATGVKFVFDVDL
jgi:hypothetical protein